MALIQPSNLYYQHLDAQLNPSKPAAPLRSQSDTASRSKSDTPSYQLPPAPTYRTRSIGGFAGAIVFERIDTSPPHEDEIIIATVRITNDFRLASQTPDSSLPSRPPRRSFLRRVSTRLSSPLDQNTYTAVKMPRREYKKYFARDRDGKYIGTEEEREWTREELDREFGCFQDLPLRCIPGGREFGEGEDVTRGGALLRDDPEVNAKTGEEGLEPKRADSLIEL